MPAELRADRLADVVVVEARQRGFELGYESDSSAVAVPFATLPMRGKFIAMCTPTTQISTGCAKRLLSTRWLRQLQTIKFLTCCIA
jgi:hypothetical protein